MKFFRLALAYVLGVLTPILIGAITTPYGKFASLPIMQRGGLQALLGLSPSNKYRVLGIYESDWRRSDRGISLWLQDAQVAKPIFKVGIQGEFGSERIIWNRNGNKFLLAGRNFRKTVPNLPQFAKISSGEIVYLIYDTDMQQVYCHEASFSPKLCQPLSEDIFREFKE
jgi:hypothetical protein